MIHTQIHTQSFGLTDQGLVRHHNEDAFKIVQKPPFFILADGLGGKNSGEVASLQAANRLCLDIEQNPLFQDESQERETIELELAKAIVSTNQSIWQMSFKDPSLHGMATTLTCALFWKNFCIFGNIGDSRIYRKRGNKLTVLTQDDSIVYELLHFGLIEENEVKTFPLKHVITKSLGSYEDTAPTIGKTEVEVGDLFLLCSDGLYGLVDDKKIEDLLNPITPLSILAKTLIDEALKHGGTDNVTVILVKVV